MNIIRSIKSALMRKVIEHSMPSGMWEWMKRQGKEPDVSRQALVGKYWGWVYNCANLSANRVAAAPLRVYASRSKGQARVKNFRTRPVSKVTAKAIRKRLKALDHVQGAEDFEELEEHPLIELFQNINDQENQFEAMELTSIMLDLTGDAFWYMQKGKFGLPEKIFVLRSQWVTIVPDQTNFIKGYRYGVEGSYNALELEANEVIHFKYPNPLDPWYGCSPVQAAAYAIESQKMREQFIIATMSNMARPDLLVRYEEGELDVKERRLLEREWNNMFRGAKNAGKVKVTDYRYAIEKLGWNPQELRFNEGEEWIMKKICGAFPVPVGLVDTTQISKAPRAGMEGSDLFMAQFNTLPRLIRLEQKMNEKLCPMYDERLFVAFDDPVPKDDVKQLNEDTQRLATFQVTINEIRKRNGEDPVAWGDLPLAPMGIAPLGSAPAGTQGDGSNSLPNGNINDESDTDTDSGSFGGASFGKAIKAGVNGMTIEVDGGHVHSSLAGIPLRIKPSRNEHGRFDKPGLNRLRATGDDVEGLRRMWDMKELKQ